MDETRLVGEAFRKAKDMMGKAGYPIGDNVRVVVDSNLGFMGYTFPKNGKFTIVVSGAAVESGMLEGLLVHEMGHVYRMRTNHPSHSDKAISYAMGLFQGRTLDRDYQQKILHDVVNHVEDLYADDISFKVFQKNNLFPPDVASHFFQGWMAPNPVVSGDARKDRCVNASLMLRNSFALSNMARHGIPDFGNKAKRANEQFLSGLPPGAAGLFQYFYVVMMELRENVTEREFKGLLGDYLEKFVRLAEGEHQEA